MGAPKSPGTITQKNQTILSPEQQKVFGLAMPSIEKYASSTPTLYPGSGIVGFNPNEEAGLSGALSAAGDAGGLAGKAGATQAQLLDPDFMLNPNQYLMNAANATARVPTQNLLENILPSIRSGATSAGGQYSGGATREGLAEGRAIEGTQRDISDAIAKMYLSNYNTGLQGLQSAVQGNQGAMQQLLFPSSVMSAVGGQQRSMEQAKLDEAIQKFYTQQDMPLLQAQQLLGLIGAMPGATGQSQVTGAVPKVSPWMQALGIGSTVAGLGSSLSSILPLLGL